MGPQTHLRPPSNGIGNRPNRERPDARRATADRTPHWKNTILVTRLVTNQCAVVSDHD